MLITFKSEIMNKIYQQIHVEFEFEFEFDTFLERVEKLGNSTPSTNVSKNLGIRHLRIRHLPRTCRKTWEFDTFHERVEKNVSISANK